MNFNENSYTVAESDGYISISLCIDGKFFVPVWAIIEISNGIATGRLCNLCTDQSHGVRTLMHYFPSTVSLSADPEDYSSAMRYIVTFRQTAYTDRDDPTPTALSSPILINITDDDIFEGVEYFQARIVETSDRFRVKIGQDTINVTITENDSESFVRLQNVCSPKVFL